MNRWDTRLRPWELILMIVMAVFLLCLSVGGHDQRQLADQVLRLHVLANSDSDEDQALKLEVRDAVLAEAEPWLSGITDRQEAERILQDHLAQISAAGQAVVDREGYPYTVRSELTTCYFPTRVYTDFAIPAGEYRALRVEIGAAEGHNWWCVVYPPLCSVGVEESEPASLGLGEEELRLITQDSPEYVIRFQCAEWWSELTEKLGGG